MKRLIIILALLAATLHGFPEEYPLKKILVLVEGAYNLDSRATGQGRQLAQLLGHFNTEVILLGSADYQNGEIENHDYLFYVGFSSGNLPPSVLCRDILTTSKQVVWINTGIDELSRDPAFTDKFGIEFLEHLSNSDFDEVKTSSHTFSKGSPDINRVQITGKLLTEVWSTARSGKSGAETPYLIRSGNLIYVADLPFLRAEANDRYLYFCDVLHDILKEKHPEAHQAIIRIEDVNTMSDPDNLRQVADILSERGIPFLVGVVPIYINPGENQRITLSDRPEIVDALKYMVKKGGSLVMHGVTHQYKGVSTVDAEFWDATNSRPLPNENPEEYRTKIETGIDEFVKNGLHPIAWETPHYMASVEALSVISQYFSTSIEQRMVINDYYYSQHFPFIIHKDIYGQKVYPENLGYVPLKPDVTDSRADVENLIKNTDGIKQVRDGIACAFFHPFLDPGLLKILADGIAAKGFTFIDLKEQPHRVKSKTSVILCGTQSFNLEMDNSYLHEQYFDQEDNLMKRSFSSERLNGRISRDITLQPGEIYVAHAVDYRIRESAATDNALSGWKKAWQSAMRKNDWQAARVKILWNPAARLEDGFDQSALARVFSSLNIQVDTLFTVDQLNRDDCNLLIVPFAGAETLTDKDIDKIVRFVEKGGNLVTDRKNRLIQKFGFTFSKNQDKLQFVRDLLYPEEPIIWRKFQYVSNFDYHDQDKVFCEDRITGLPVVIGRDWKAGKIIYFNTAFDPLTPDGYSCYPFAMEYFMRFFGVMPIIRRENLEMYFDPGFRTHVSEEELVSRWVKQGIRIVHAAGWHQYPKYTYNYANLIRLAHANGILVYAWIEPPQVSKMFWQDHPEWREKNYLGQDLHMNDTLTASWRYPVALTDKDCFSTAMDVYLKLLKDFDFDGVNIAELNFDAGRGFDEPLVFTPMHPSARQEFQVRYGYDLRDIFKAGSPHYWKNHPAVKQQVTEYRTDKVSEFHETLLSEISGFAKTRDGFNIVVTFYDSYFSPEITEYHGVSSDRIIELQKKYDFLLQPEDPESRWSTGPGRYIEMGRLYAQKMTDSTKLMLDLNILQFRDPEQDFPFPTLLQTGIESYQLVNAASKGAVRFTIYSESSCNPQDLALFPYAASGMVSYKTVDDGFIVNSPCSFVLQLPVNKKVMRVDGQLVTGYRNNHFIIPAGEHRIKIRQNEIQGISKATFQPELLSFTGNLLSINYEMNKVIFNYSSCERTLASLNQEPASILLDGEDYKLESLKGNDCYTVMLPAGNHKAELITGNRFSHGINLASLWSVSAIAIYGLLAFILLILMIVSIKIIRRRYEK